MTGNAICATCNRYEHEGSCIAPPTLFIYHGNCFDGFTAAWIYFGFVDNSAEFVGVKYGDPVPDVRGRDVIIADFSWPREQMFKIACDAQSLTVLDHHHTAQEALEGLERQVLLETGKEIRVVFDMNRSGAGIAWDILATGPRPDLVNYIEDRDLWRKALPQSEAVSATIAATPMTFEGWDLLDSAPVGELIIHGSGILAYIHQYGTKALAEAHPRDWRGLHEGLDGWCVTHAPIWCVNMPYMNSSEHLNRLLEEKQAQFVASYFQRGDGRWQFSLRSRSDFDCSAVAKLFGGGGHKQAAGFDVASLDEVFV